MKNPQHNVQGEISMKKAVQQREIGYSPDKRMEQTSMWPKLDR